MKVVIAGAGFVGLAAARVFHAAGWEVVALTHSAESAAQLADQPFASGHADLSQSEAMARVADLCRGAAVVVHCASSGRGGPEAYRAVYLEGARNILECWAPGRLIFTSSTSVYAQTDGHPVTEDDPAEPTRETGKILRATEELVLAHRGIVARLAGLYGPGRSVLLRKFLHGEAVIEGDGRRVINQIHRDDAAAALLTLATRAAPGIYNVSDDQPLEQHDVYGWLATHFSRPLPPTGPIDPDRKRGWTSKRVINTRLRALGWAPTVPSFFAAVAAGGDLLTLAQLPPTS